MVKRYSKKEVSFALRIIEDFESGKITNQRNFSERKFYWSKELALSEMPTHPFILSKAKSPSKLMKQFLSIKPTRSLSGVQTIAVMLPPFPCPADCTYCPSAFSGKRAPKSYTGFEPSTLRAQRLNFDSFQIVSNRISQLDLTGNAAGKIELIFQGSTFNAFPEKLQDAVVHDSLDGIIGRRTSSLEKSKALAEKSRRRVVGITFETRPDWCTKDSVNKMLQLGATRVELGVQSPSDESYKLTNRGHTVQDVINATALLKDSAFKVLYHLMPGLPGSSYSKDLKSFKRIFSDPNFRPDMVKFYPCLVIEGTKLFEQFKKGEFVPMDEKKAVRVIARVQESIPKWVRVMRINRDIPSTVISAGVKKTNLRQLVDDEMHKLGIKCNCIRCREIGLQSRDGETDYEKEFAKAKLRTEFYAASKGEEAFISFESKNSLFGFVRLRKPSAPFVKGLSNKTALIRELHVYGKALAVGKSSGESPQHKGIGKKLLREAERIAEAEFDADKIAIISGLGVREYYKKNFSYNKEEPYMVKRV